MTLDVRRIEDLLAAIDFNLPDEEIYVTIKGKRRSLYNVATHVTAFAGLFHILNELEQIKDQLKEIKCS